MALRASVTVRRCNRHPERLVEFRGRSVAPSDFDLWLDRFPPSVQRLLGSTVLRSAVAPPEATPRIDEGHKVCSLHAGAPVTRREQRCIHDTWTPRLRPCAVLVVSCDGDDLRRACLLLVGDQQQAVVVQLAVPLEVIEQVPEGRETVRCQSVLHQCLVPLDADQEDACLRIKDCIDPSPKRPGSELHRCLEGRERAVAVVEVLCVHLDIHGQSERRWNTRRRRPHRTAHGRDSFLGNDANAKPVAVAALVGLVEIGQQHRSMMGHRQPCGLRVQSSNTSDTRFR